MPDIFDIVGGQLQTATPAPSGDIFDQVAQQLTTPTPTPAPTAVAETGEEDGFLAKINAALRKPTPYAPLRNFEEATRENVMAMMPHDLPSYLKSILGPAGTAYEQGKALAQGDVGSIPLVGRVPEIIEAEETPAFSKERIGTSERTVMDLLALAGAGAKPRIPLRAEPAVPPPASVAEAIKAQPPEVPLAERITQPRVEPPPETPVLEVTAPVTPPTPKHTSEISTAPSDARTYIAQRVSEGLTREQALAEWQQKVAEHKAKMKATLPIGSQVKTAEGIFELTEDGWAATEGGGGRGVLLSNPEGEIIRIGDPTASKALPTGPAPPETPPAPEAAPPPPGAGARAYTVENQVKSPRDNRMRPGVTVFDGPVDNPTGIIEAERLRTGELQVFNVAVDPTLRGTGRGVGLYEKLIEEAKGAPIVSDTSVSESAAHAIEGLGRRGHTVEKNPNAVLTEGQWKTPDETPVFKITGKEPPPPGVRAPVEQPSRAGPPPPVPPEDVPFTPEGGGAPAPKTRKFSLQLQADTDLIQNIKDNIGNQTYEPIPRTVTMDQAAKLVDERPIHEVITAIKDEANGISGRVRATMGEMAIKRLNKAARDLAESGKTAEADVAADRTIDIAEWMMEYGTRSGQTVQAFSNYALLGPEAKLMDVTRKVRKARANREHEFPGEVDEITGALNSDDPVAAFRKLFKTNKTARKVKPRMQKLIEAAKTGKLGEQEFYDIASDRLGLPKYDPATAREIMRMAQEIDQLPEGMPRDEATLKLNKFIATKMGFRPSDLPMGVYYGNMLSGYNTHIVNALDTFLNVSSEVSGMAMSNPRSAMKIFGNTIKGFGEGRADALMALSRGRMLTNSRWMEIPRLMEAAKFGEKGGVPPLGKGIGGRVMHAIAESPAGYPLNAWKYVGRLMSASDSIMFRGAKEARAALLADRVGRGEGLRGKALRRRVQEELGRTTEQETLYEQQAKSEGYSGPSAQARLNELRERGRSMEANADADEWAGLATYNHKPQGTLGFLANKVAETSDKLPALKTVVPFTNIVANVTNRGLNYTPLGYYRAFHGFGEKGPMKGDARNAMLTRATMGTAGLTLLKAIEQQGMIEIHGAGPSDPDRRKQLQDRKWKPYSIKVNIPGVGEKYMSYLPTPLGLGLSILGNWNDVTRYGEMDQKSAAMRGAYALTRVGSTVFNQSFLSSLSTLFEALSGQSPGQQLSAWRRLVSGTTGTFTTPRIVMDVQRIFDPKRYESSTLAGDLLRNTPFSSLINRPTLNAFGEPIEPPTNRFISTPSDDPAWRVIADANLRVPVPDKYTTMPDGRGGKRQITPDEYYEYMEKSGPLLKQYIVRDAFNLTHMEPDKAQDLLSKKSQEIRGRVLKELRSRAQFTPAD